MKNRSKILLATTLVIAVIAGLSYKLTQKRPNISISSNDHWIGEPYAGFKESKLVKARKFLISTSNEMASKAGTEILSRGGSAIDAAIAAQMALNVVEPESSGIGGGAFLVYYDANSKTTHYFNGRETAPREANEKIFLNEKGEPRSFEDVVRGGLSVGTPGLLKLLKEVHERYGKLPWEELFTPAIKIARQGFPIDHRIYNIISSFTYMKDFEKFAKLYLNEDGSPKEVGVIVKNPDLAETFTILAQGGIEPFYQGKIGQDVVEAVRNSKINPGYLSMADLKSYQIKEGNLICSTYRSKYKVCSMPLPSSGGITLLQILGILENFDLADLKPQSAEAVHLIAEATRLAYADRNQYLGDVVYVPVKQMLDKGYLKMRSSLINNEKAMEKAEFGVFPDFVGFNYQTENFSSERPSTTHLSIVDEEGNAISLTSSIEYMFGSVLMVDGFMLNNQLTDFSFVPQIDGKPVANRLEPGKQPRSSMSPTLVFDDKNNLLMVIGSPGGPRIIQYVLKAILDVLEWKMDIQQAISMPNYVVLNDVIELEKRTDLEYLEPELVSMGHQVKIVDINSGLNGIMINNNILEGGADPRRAGSVLGW